MDLRAFVVVAQLGVLSACATTAMGIEEPPGAQKAGGEAYDLSAAQARGLAPVEVPASSESPAILMYNARIMTAMGETYDPGYILLKEGRIADIGEGEPPEFPGVHRLRLDDHIITPGIIDAHSHLGVYPSPEANAHDDGNEATAPLTPGVWAEHSFWPQDPGLQYALAGGVTTLQALPGSANLIGGRGVTLHMVPQRGSRAMRFPGAPETAKFACGENPKRVYGNRSQAPSTRMGNLKALRQAFLDAEHYRAQWEAYEAALKADPTSGTSAPKRDLDLETLVGVMEGAILPQIHCYRSDDMLSMIQVSHEFGFEIRAFHHALEAYKIRDILAAEGIAVATWADWWGFKMEAYDGIPENAALMAEAGGIAHIHSDSALGIRRLLQEAGKAYYAGVHRGMDITEDEGLRWLTANPAWILGIDDEVGTLEVGKRADVVVWELTPQLFSSFTRAKYVFIDGALRYNIDSIYGPNIGFQILDDAPPPQSDFLLGQEVTP